MKKFILGLVAAAVAAPIALSAGSASALVNVTDGVGTIGKGDVQTALRYKNDTAFQADAANITFSLGDSTVHYVAYIFCSAQNVWQPGDAPMGQVQADMGIIGTVSNTANIAVSKNGAGKVTGYTVNGSTPGAASALDYSKIDWSKWSTCPAGEHFMGWSEGPTANPFHVITVPGSSVLQVSNGVTTVELPNTPVV